MTSPLFVSRFGRGAPLLCLHGIEAHGLRFVGLATHLAGVEIIAPDLRGHGRSIAVVDLLHTIPADGPEVLAAHVRSLRSV